MIASIIDTLGNWGWIVAGLILGALELVAPGVFLIWLGLAAVLTGVIAGIFGLSWQVASIVFAVLAVACVIVGRMLTHDSTDETPEQPHLNRRGESLVGKTFKLDAPITNGEGKIRVGDSVWRVSGPDMLTGATVRVRGVDGATLVVEPA